MTLQITLAFAVMAIASSAAAQQVQPPATPSQDSPWRIVPMTPKPLFTAPLPQDPDPTRPQVDTKKTPPREPRYDARPDETPSTTSPCTIIRNAMAAEADKTINCVMPVIVGNTKLDPSFAKPVPPQPPDSGVIAAPKCAPKK